MSRPATEKVPMLSCIVSIKALTLYEKAITIIAEIREEQLIDNSCFNHQSINFVCHSAAFGMQSDICFFRSKYLVSHASV
jgi:hypothetical protein